MGGIDVLLILYSISQTPLIWLLKRTIHLDRHFTRHRMFPLLRPHLLHLYYF